MKISAEGTNRVSSNLVRYEELNKENRQQGMGVCQYNNRASSNTYSTKAIRKPIAFPETDFYFSTESLVRIDMDVVILFADESFTLKKNPFLSRVNARDSHRICQLTEAFLSQGYLEATDSKESSSLQYKAYLESLRFASIVLSETSFTFKKAIIVSLNAWNGHKENEIHLNAKISAVFDEIQKMSIKSVAFTECNPALGIPLGVLTRALLKAIEYTELSMLTVVCLEEGAQNIFMQETAAWKKEVENSFISTPSISKSVYY